MSFKVIHDLIDAQIHTVEDLPVFQTENTLFKPANTPAWCRGTLLPAETTNQTVGPNGYQRKYGLYQLDLFYINNIGYVDALTMADCVVAVFPKSLLLTDGILQVSIIRAFIDSARPFQNYYQLPVLVEWECFV
jgi:hypothetical protein